MNQRDANVEHVPRGIPQQDDSDTEAMIGKAILSCQPKDEGEYSAKIFSFCRYLKALPMLAELPFKCLKPYVKKWHHVALSIIGAKSLDDTWSDFVYGWEKVKFPVGENTLKKAVQNALDAQYTLDEEGQYDSDEVRLLVKVCYELHKLTLPEPFWLSCRSAGGILGVSHERANKYLHMLVGDGNLKIVEKGNTAKASRFLYMGGEEDNA